MREEFAVSRLDDHRRDDAGKPLDADQWDRLIEKEWRETGTPRDCVTEVPLHGGLQLVSWDLEGHSGPTAWFPADQVEDRDHIYLLDRCRAIYRKTHPPHLKVG